MERPLRGRLEISNPLSQPKEEAPFFYWQDCPKTPSSFCNPSLIGITPGSLIGGKLVTFLILAVGLAAVPTGIMANALSQAREEINKESNSNYPP